MSLLIPTIPRADVASHNTGKSCYVSIGGNVYDITSFLEDHPGGGDLILKYGGKDVSAIMADELSHQHSIAAYEILNDNLIGVTTPKDTPADIVKIGSKQATGLYSEPPDDNGPSSLTDDFRQRRFLDLNKPLLRQVWNGGFSKAFYLEQVHRPRYYTKGDGSAPLFGNFLEPFTKCSWWLVPVIWLPPVLYGTFMADQGMASSERTAEFWLVGFLLWSFVEYGVHRWLFHCDKWVGSVFL